MKGIADGAGVDFADILALNVRTEISMGLGLPSDGCTSLFYKPSDSHAILAQNWDWETAQQMNLVALHIASRGDLPAISMITEAGIIGKIGLNGSGVGVCLNAIRARGVDFERLPVHIALRLVLECRSREQAVATLTTAGVAASCHILVADAGDAIGLECSHVDMVGLPARGGIYTHTNHWLVQHSGPGGPITEPVFPQDSVPRLARLNSLIIDRGKKSLVNVKGIEKMLEDEDNFPGSINKATSSASSAATLFSVVMDLDNRRANVRIGRPTEAVESFTLQAACS
jgi:isopenicillin-N N-acyltransferase-like protein